MGTLSAITFQKMWSNTIPFKWKLVAGVLLAATGLWVSTAQAIGPEELGSLLDQHPAQEIAEDKIASLPAYEEKIELAPGRGAVLFRIPGFEQFGCSQCHQPQDLTQSAAEHLRSVIGKLETAWPEAKPLPLKQYIIQPYTDKLLQAGQLAHATFDTIRVFPGTLIIDSKAYSGNTHLHEALHLNQPFLGHVNELEAYSVNALEDPRFLLLNYPYFADSVAQFFEPEMDTLLADWYARDTSDDAHAPREAQWFLMPFDETRLEKLKTAAPQLKSLLKEASRIYRAHPLETSYLTEQTGVHSLVLDLAAVKTLNLPAPELAEDVIAKAMEVFDQQMRKTDNTRLGYVIDRKTESMMTLQYASPVKDKRDRRLLYFHYLKKRFLNDAAELKLVIEDEGDFKNFIRRKREGVEKMIDYPGLTEIEREGARRLLKTLPAP